MTSIRVTAVAVFIVVTLLPPAVPVVACPYCDSEVGKQVAAGIFNERFITNVLLTLAPFPILLLVVGLIHFGLPTSPRKSRSHLGRME